MEDAAMNNTFLTLKLFGKRDILLARQRARQIARLLGYEPLEQSWIAASVFEMARSALQSQHKATLDFELKGNLLAIAVSCGKPPKSKKNPSRLFPLPNNPMSQDRHDLPWIARELDRLTPFNLFEEIQQQNLEILQLSNLLGRHHARASQGSAA
jgi:hypothetical protein